jgi:mono/diheme cytochrome c family protein
MVMSHVWYRVQLAAVALVLGGGTAVAASAEKGQRLFIQNGCWQCHGTVGQGAVTGPKLGPDPLPAEAFVAFVRTTNRAMPPYRAEILPDEDLADIYAYLQSVPKPADYKTIPLITQAP